MNTILNLQLPQYGGNFFTSWKIIIFSKKTLFHGVRLRVHVNDNYILSPPPSPLSLLLFHFSLQSVHAYKLVKLSPIFPLSLQVEWCCTNWVLQMCIIFTIYIHPVVFLLLLL